MFTIQQFDSAVQKFLEQNTRDAVRYNSASLAKTISDRMQQDGLPTVISARVIFDALVREGKLKPTDGKSDEQIKAEELVIARANLDKVVAEVYSQPITVEFEEYCASLDQRTLSRLFYGEDDDAVNEFAIKYRRLANERGYRIPERFADQGQAVPEEVRGVEVELTIQAYNVMPASEVKTRLRNPKFKEAVYKLIQSGQLR